MVLVERMRVGVKEMTKLEYIEFHKRCCDLMVEITKKKNADYTGTGDDPFKNFSRIGASNPSWALIGFLTRMSDKFARLESFVERGHLLVADESFEDTALDLANYCILMIGFVAAQREKEGKDKSEFMVEMTHEVRVEV
jgi:hypothetical protein